MVDGYTFSQNTSRIWICSKYPKCKAKVSRNVDGTISLMSKFHNHEPDKIDLSITMWSNRKEGETCCSSKVIHTREVVSSGGSVPPTTPAARRRLN